LIREILRDGQWQRIEGLLPGKPGDPGVTAANSRRFVEAVLWIGRTGSPWRDLPDAFGNWNSTWRRFRPWALKGVFDQVFRAMAVPCNRVLLN
jgi:transposase